ncbi:MAG: cation diffusion facilitator family transporter [Bacteroidales bacterium]|nr:cation diffusion facilitator family transporter [Bacteroidales bacterium]MDD4176185.1 cation diffusion facilitator family transporter [Bacteroidales bacterium]MDD4741930.1 cation diffusion facilitator family transporter [Bacteroidales bacterium]
MPGTIHRNKAQQNTRIAYLEGWVSFGVNLFLFAIKLWAGLVTGSVAIVADAWHTLSDSLSSVVVIFGARVSAKPPDKEHPFGHGRAELIASVLIAALLGFVAYEFINQSIVKLAGHESVNFGTIAIVVTIISIVVKEGLAQYAFRAARKTNYSSLRADGWHHRTDAISSVIILVGIFAGKYFWWIDGVMGILVAIMIFWAGYGILKQAMSRLLGEAPQPDLVHHLTASAKKITQLDLRIHHIHLHEYGDHKELTFHVKLPPKMTVEEAHDLIEKVENQIWDDLGLAATVHMEPRRH